MEQLIPSQGTPGSSDASGQSGGGPHALQDASRWHGRLAFAPASWSAPALWRFPPPAGGCSFSNRTTLTNPMSQPHTKLKHDVPAVAREFQIHGELLNASPYGTGHINDTYCAVYQQ